MVGNYEDLIKGKWFTHDEAQHQQTLLCKYASTGSMKVWVDRKGNEWCLSGEPEKTGQSKKISRFTKRSDFNL